MHEKIVATGFWPQDRVTLNHAANQRAEIVASGIAAISRRTDDITPVDSGEMDDHLIVVSAAEHKPGVTFVGQPARARDLETGLNEDGLDTVKFRDVLRRPIRRDA